MVSDSELDRILEIPYGQDVGHAEGMTLFSPDGGAARSLLVVYDSVSQKRQPGKNALTVDVFPLPEKLQSSRVW